MASGETTIFQNCKTHRDIQTRRRSTANATLRHIRLERDNATTTSQDCGSLVPLGSNRLPHQSALVRQIKRQASPLFLPRQEHRVPKAEPHLTPR